VDKRAFGRCTRKTRLWSVSKIEKRLIKEAGKMNSFEFVFVQSGEFNNPIYELSLCGEVYGIISYYEGRWWGTLYTHHSHVSSTFKIMAKKIEELDGSLAQERRKFFGF